MKKRHGRLNRLIALLTEYAGRSVTLDEIITVYMARHDDEAYNTHTMRALRVTFGVWMRRAIDKLNAERVIIQRTSDLGRAKKAVFSVDESLKMQENSFLPP